MSDMDTPITFEGLPQRVEPEPTLVTHLATLLTRLDGMVALNGRAVAGRLWDPWKAVRDELDAHGYPSIPEYVAASRRELASEILNDSELHQC